MTNNKNLMIGLLLALGLMAMPAGASDERAKRDVNQVPGMLGVTDAAAPELRQVHTTAEGYLLATSTGPGYVRADQGNAGASAWPMYLLQGGNSGVITADGALRIDGSRSTQPVSNDQLVSLDAKVPAQGQALMAASLPVVIASNQSDINIADGGNTITVDGTITANQGGAWDVTILNGSGASAVNVQDGGNSLTVDGTITLLVNDGVDIGDVTINNAGGAAAVNIQDGGNAITVDASDLDVRDLTSVSDSVSVLQATHDSLNGNMTIQVGDVDVANGNPVPVSDAGGALTVDASNLDIRDLTSVSDTVGVLQATHDSLNANANIQVGDADVANGNPVPVSDAGGALTVDASNLDVRDLSSTQDSVKAEPSAWSTVLASTGSCGATATLALPADALAKTSLFCNESADVVRIGAADVTAAVGLKVLGNTCVPMDGPTSAFQGALYCIRTIGSDQAFSTMVGR